MRRCRFTAAGLREERKKAPENRQGKREEKEADRVDSVPGATVEKLGPFQSRVDWTDPRTRKPAFENPESSVL